MTKDEALRLALEALESGEKMQSGRLLWIEHDISLVKQAITVIKAALKAKDEPMKKLQVTLEDRPVDIELAQYKRMFEAACSTLGAVSHALGCDPDEGGAEPLLAAIEELKGQTTPPQRKPLTIDAIIELAQEIDWPAGAYIDFARAIESAHGIKEEA